MALTAFIETASPNCINGTGQVTLGQFKSCAWMTPNGATAVVVITNAGTSTLTIVVSGAPATIFATDGAPLNGLHAIPPNANANVTAMGNFLGQQVMLFNISTPATNAFIVTSAPVPC